MTALLLQVLATVLTLAFGGLAFGVWWSGRRSPDPLVRGWGVTGAYFLLIGAYSSVHALLLVAAVRAWPGSPLSTWVAAWSSAASIGRGVTSLGFPVLLAAAVLPRRARGSGGLLRHMGVLAVLAAAGTVGAKQLHDGSAHQYMSALAVLSTILAISLMVVLLMALAADRLDQLLWFALATYTLREVIGVSLLTIFAWWNLAANPAAFYIFYGLSIAVTAVLCLLGARRLALMRAGKKVPALLQRIHPVQRPATG